MSSFNLAVGQCDLAVLGDSKQCVKYGYIAHYGLFCSHAECSYDKLGHTVFMNICNIDGRQRLTYHIWVELCYVMSVSNESSDLLVSTILLSQDWIIIISTVNFKIDNITFTIQDSFEGQPNWKINKIAPSSYAINICIYRLLCLDGMVFV